MKRRKVIVISILSSLSACAAIAVQVGTAREVPHNEAACIYYYGQCINAKLLAGHRLPFR